MEFDFSLEAVAQEYRRSLNQDSALDGNCFLEVRGDQLNRAPLSWQVRAQLARVIDSMGQASSLVGENLSNKYF